MRSRRILYLFSVSLLFLNACKKDNPPDPVTPSTITVDENGGVSVGADASGAFYSLFIREYSEPGSSTHDDYETAMAWLGSPTDMKDAGAITINGKTIQTLGTGANVYFSDGSPIFNGNNVSWTVGGNAANGIAGFSHTENMAFPAGGEFSLPSTIDITKSLTVAHTPTTGIVIYSVAGEKGVKTKVVEGAASSVTFTPAEMAEAAIPNDEINVTVMPVVVSPAATYNGKKYYFVKQFAHLRWTATQ